jgi:hypothetical protein
MSPPEFCFSTSVQNDSKGWAYQAGHWALTYGRIKSVMWCQEIQVSPRGSLYNGKIRLGVLLPKEQLEGGKATCHSKPPISVVNACHTVPVTEKSSVSWSSEIITHRMRFRRRGDFSLLAKLKTTFKAVPKLPLQKRMRILGESNILLIF